MKRLMVCLLLALSAGVLSAASDFGRLSDGRATRLYRLVGADGMTIEVTDYGGRLVRCLVPDRKGMCADVALGFNSAAEYETNGFSVGTLIGRFGNRIRDGKFTLDGQEFRLPINETNPPPRHCTLHGGSGGWDTKVWLAQLIVEADTKTQQRVPGLELTLVSPDGDMGFPGKVTCKVTYRVRPGNVVTLDYEATTDKPTVVNLTHHGYWNLAGEASDDVRDHELKVYADRYMRTDDGLIPVAYEPVQGTGFDFTELRRIGAYAGWMARQQSLRCTDNWYDHNFVLRGKPGRLHPAAVLRDPKSGRKMEVWTTEPCMQIYGAQNFNGAMKAKSPFRTYGQYAGVALETQHAPDSPNHPDWPTTVLRPGETFRSHTEYRFSAD